jgi:L-malate glycosyltransferase
MKVLHLCNAYSNHCLYKELFLHLDQEDLIQFVYQPTRNENEKHLNNIVNNPRIQVYSDYFLKNYHRLLFRLKIKQVQQRVIDRYDIKSIDLIHCHFLFSDGAVALELKKKFSVPYIVTVRNTDVNTFFRHMRHLRSKGIEILLNASKIIFITPSYIDTVLNKYIPQKFHTTIKTKIIILPNGVSDFWHLNKAAMSRVKKEYQSVLYVGDFSSNKNVIAIIDAIEQLNTEGHKIKLNLVGGENFGPVIKRIKQSNPEIVHYFERTNDKNELLKHYRANDVFVMPSFKETFGTVYLEAMSQGLPIIYSKGQGVDGYFNEIPCGYAVNPYDSEEIKNGILKALINIEPLSKNSLVQINKFSWNIIADEYRKIYSSSL